MKINKPMLLATLFTTALVMTTAPAIAAPSAKFAAHIAQSNGETMHLLASGVEATEIGVATGADNEDSILQATIKTAQKKDLLIGVSLQSGIYTSTTVKGKNGSSEQAGAEGAIMVRVEIPGTAVYPTTVIFAKRIQELTATLGGVIERCDVTLTDTDGDLIPDTGEIIVARDCVVTEEEIGLMLNTTSANHFNFVAPNLAAGEHTVTVTATALASAQFTNGVTPVYDTEGAISYIPTADNAAKAWAVVDIGSLTVEEVRAVNNDTGITIDLDAGN